MTIQRYTGENVEFHATGDMVAYEDYAELKEEYERLDKSHSMALAKIDALAAENAALKGFGDKLYSMYKGLETSGGGFHDEQSITYQQAALDAAMSEFDGIKTPATDAILASVRAEGVEMFAYYISIYNSDAERHAHSFAAQLRSKSEVQS